MLFKFNTKLFFSFSLFLFFCFLSPSLALAEESLYFIHQDHLGSTNIVTNQDGEIVSKQNYYPYGGNRITQGDIPTERQYTSQVSDQTQTGLYYYNARYYNPQIALFTQADIRMGLNRYAYVRGNPVVRVDAGGTDDICVEPEKHENTLISRLDEPVDVAKERERIMKQYDLLIGAQAKSIDIMYDYSPASVLESDFWSKKELGIIADTLDVLRPEAYQGSLLFRMKNTKVGGYGGGSPEMLNMVGLNSSYIFSSDFRNILVHEYTHVWQARNQDSHQDFIALAENYGFRELSLEEQEQRSDYVEYYLKRGNLPFKLSLMYKNVDQNSPEFNQYPFTTFLSGYGLVNWNELGATMAEWISGTYWPAGQNWYKDNAPEIYDFYWDNLFIETE